MLLLLIPTPEFAQTHQSSAPLNPKLKQLGGETWVLWPSTAVADHLESDSDGKSLKDPNPKTLNPLNSILS